MNVMSIVFEIICDCSFWNTAKKFTFSKLFLWIFIIATGIIVQELSVLVRPSATAQISHVAPWEKLIARPCPKGM